MRPDPVCRRSKYTVWAAVLALLLGINANVLYLIEVHSNARVQADLANRVEAVREVLGQRFDDMRGMLIIASHAGSCASARNAVPAADAASADAPRDRVTASRHVPASRANKSYRTRSESKAFFEQNARRPGVVSLDSGLQYRVFQRGEGPAPGPNDRVVMRYRASLTDGTEIYDTRSTGQPVEFDVGQLIPGLREAVLLMRAGAHWQLYIPTDLVYHGGVRKRKKYGYEPLVYDLELIAVIEAR